MTEKIEFICWSFKEKQLQKEVRIKKNIFNTYYII